MSRSTTAAQRLEHGPPGAAAGRSVPRGRPGRASFRPCSARPAPARGRWSRRPMARRAGCAPARPIARRPTWPCGDARRAAGKPVRPAPPAAVLGRAFWPFRHPLDFVGSDGGGGIGGGPGIAVGAALALRGSGRLPVAICGDGDFLMGVTALWTAVHYRIPLLIVIANNRSFFNDEVHQERVARMRGRPVENKWIGQRMADPGDRPRRHGARPGRHRLRTGDDAAAAGRGPMTFARSDRGGRGRRGRGGRCPGRARLHARHGRAP
jgi:hypothetical protein